MYLLTDFIENFRHTFLLFLTTHDSVLRELLTKAKVLVETKSTVSSLQYRCGNEQRVLATFFFQHLHENGCFFRKFLEF